MRSFKTFTLLQVLLGGQDGCHVVRNEEEKFIQGFGGKTYRKKTTDHINLLNPTGHVMHQQFNIQQLYVLPTLCLCVLYLSENRQRPVPLTA